MNAADERSLPQWKLERYALGELPAEELARIEELLETNPTLNRRLQDLRGEDEACRERYPAQWMARRIRRRAVEKGPRVRAWGRLPAWGAGVALAALALAAVPVLMDEKPADQLTRIKAGGASLSLYRQTSAGSERLADGTRAFAGDRIQVGYKAAGRAYGVIFSVDGGGTLTWHFPTEGGRAAALVQEGLVPLEFSYELDAAPRWERFFLLTSAEPFGVDGLAAPTAQAVGGAVLLDLPPGLEQASFTLVKGAAPRGGIDEETAEETAKKEE